MERPIQGENMTTKREERAAQLVAELPHFTGSEEYHTIVYP
jgi:hypothetical protein